MIGRAAAALFLAFFASAGSAAETTPTLSEDFAQPVPTIVQGRGYTTKQGWRVFSGQWDFVDGALRGKQLPTDARGAFVVYYHRFTSAVIQFDVKLEGCRQMIFRIQDAVPEHICSVRISPEGFIAQKDDHDHKGPDEAVPFGRASLEIAKDAWKAVRVEIVGEKMTTTIDGRTVAGTHPLLAAEKSTIEFVVAGNTASFRNVRMWVPAPAK